MNKTAYRVGQTVYMTEDAIENYGEEFRNKPLVITHVATKYMPAKDFFAQGRPKGFHPGYDEEMDGMKLYAFEDLNYSLYEYEVQGTKTAKTPAEKALGLDAGELYGEDEEYFTSLNQTEYRGYIIDLSYNEMTASAPYTAFVSGIGSTTSFDEELAINNMKAKIDKILDNKTASIFPSKNDFIIFLTDQYDLNLNDIHSVELSLETLEESRQELINNGTAYNDPVFMDLIDAIVFLKYQHSKLLQNKAWNNEQHPIQAKKKKADDWPYQYGEPNIQRFSVDELVIEYEDGSQRMFWAKGHYDPNDYPVFEKVEYVDGVMVYDAVAESDVMVFENEPTEIDFGLLTEFEQDKLGANL